MNNGWVKLHRKIMDSQVWQNPNLLHVWVYCLLEANHVKKWVPVHGVVQPVGVEAGQFITGRFALHKGLFPKKKKANPCAKTTWRWLQNLEMMQNLSIETSSRFSLITICNWERYQADDRENVQTDVQPVSSRCPTGVQPVSTTKKVKKVKKVKKKEGGGQKPPAPYRAFTDYFTSRWSEQYGVPVYPWKAKTGPAAAGIWKVAGNNLATAKAIADRFLANDEQFYHGHTLAMLNSQIAKFLTDPPGNGNGEQTELDLFHQRIRREAAGQTEETDCVEG